MKRKGHIVGLVILLLLIFAVIRLAVAFTRFSQVEKASASVELGQSRTSVLTTLGRPNYHEGGCGVIHFPDKRCATEYVYSHPFAPLMPKYFIVAFSSDGRVIEAEWWTSP